MTPQEWSRIQQGIFRGESGGDYGALFGYQNRPNGRFEGTDLTKMTVDQALDFAKPSGPYGQYVKGEVGRVATPMGAYQVVGTTLRDAKNALGLTGNEVMDQGLQDKIGQWIYKSQGTGAWEGYKPINEDQAIASDTMRVLGKQPKGLLASAQATDDTESKMIPEEKPKGLLGSLGIQKMVEGAEGEAGQRFYNRDSFKDTAAILAQGFGRMGVMGMEKIADQVANQRTEAKARNKSLEFLAGLPGGEEFVRIAKAAGLKAAMQAYLESRKASAGGKDTALIRNALAAGFKPGTKEYQRFIASGGDIYSQETAMMLGLPKPEAGMNYEFEKGEAGNITGYKLVPIEGGSAELEAQQLADKQAKGQSGQEQKDVSFYAAGERVLGELKKEGAFLPATGIAASAVRNTPGIKLFAQRQENVAQDLAIMESQMQFETLADLKAASPTGASGLGQLTDAERRALGKLKYNFDTSQDETAIRRTIRSAMLMKSYFENGILDPVTNGYRNATPEEMDQMSNGINPFSAEGGPMLKDVERYLGGPQTIDADDGQYVIKKVTE